MKQIPLSALMVLTVTCFGVGGCAGDELECDRDDAIGAGADASVNGNNGTSGSNGTNGVNGVNGVNGSNGTNGTSGPDAGPRGPDATSPGGPDASVRPPECEPACGAGTVCAAGTCVSSISGNATIDGILLGDSTAFDTEVLRSQQPDLSWQPSKLYKWRDFVSAVQSMHVSGVGDFKLWLGDPSASDEVRARQGLVNLAAFLAQSMKETIQYDACDENNWDNTNGYRMENACGQLEQKYEDYDCDMACPKDPTMQITAATNAIWWGAPGPMFCAPDSVLIAAGKTPNGATGYWNHSSDCWPYPATQAGFQPANVPAWQRPNCEVYVGQKGGAWVWDGSGGSVEGCCWWGRGVIQTTGRCNFGILNHYLGDTHLSTAEFPRSGSPLYPELNFCRDPEVICNNPNYPELKWVAGLFYWMSSVETYDVGGWNYLERLETFVAGGMTDDAFIDSVSGIVNRGCHNPPCGTGPLDGGSDRRANFDKVLRAMNLR